jgi:DNA (cytosine-5)-methyltransferase 1
MTYDVATGRGMRILDLFCGAGGAAMGLHWAFPKAEIVGVDIKPQPRYPFTFVRHDALTYPWEGFTFFWASPPCQRHLRGLNNSPGFVASRFECHIAATRARLKNESYCPIPFCIENVPGAPLYWTLKLGGWMFPELKVIRERWFETNFVVRQPNHVKPKGLLHKGYLSIAGTGIQKWCNDRGYKFGVADARKAMGIDWMTRKELSQAIPPSYSRYIGEQFKLSRLGAATPAGSVGKEGG